MTASLEPWISESEMTRCVRGVVLRGSALFTNIQKTFEYFLNAANNRFGIHLGTEKCVIKQMLKD